LHFYETKFIRFLGNVITFLCGGEPRPTDQFFHLLQNTPYLACVQITENQNSWKFTETPIAPLTHSMNASYDPKQLTMPVPPLEERVKRNHS
ncbi:unnamed protein product, partial [Heligmosomoides polygyrus]|uniref:HECT domain-containing protein n=1 Tax=Heligmosomoides polygyrus TaxID=6339 RepID=A0A183FWP7_HELPZ